MSTSPIHMLQLPLSITTADLTLNPPMPEMESIGALDVTEACPSHFPLRERSCYFIPLQTRSSSFSSRPMPCPSLHCDLGHILFLWELGLWDLHIIPGMVCGWIPDLKISSRM